MLNQLMFPDVRLCRWEQKRSVPGLGSGVKLPEEIDKEHPVLERGRISLSPRSKNSVLARTVVVRRMFTGACALLPGELTIIKIDGLAAQSDANVHVTSVCLCACVVLPAAPETTAVRGLATRRQQRPRKEEPMLLTWMCSAGLGDPFSRDYMGRTRS